MRDVLEVFGTAGRLLLRHWPALFTLAFLGAGLRNATVYAAIRLSEVQGQLALLVLVLAPLCYLLPVVAMLSVCRRSLPALQSVDATTDVASTERRPLRLLDVAVSVLVPFMAVYSSYGLLEQDLTRFRNVAAADVYTRERLSITPEELDGAGRLGIYTVQVALLIVVGAWLVRFAIGRVERTLKLRALAYVGAFVEVYYTAQLAGQLVVLKVNGLPWLEDRVAVRWIQDAYDAIADALGPLAGLFTGAVHGTEALLSSLDAVVVVPVGWLAVAAVVLGFKLLEEEVSDEPVARGAVGALKADLKERWAALANGVRLLAAGGLVPMMVFALVFLLVTRIPLAVHHLFRAVVGPRYFATWVAIEPFQTAVGFALLLALSTPMLAAAVDWLIRARTAARTPAPPTTPAPA